MRPTPDVPVKLPLSPAELWTVHHVLFHRIERAERFPARTDPPTIEAVDALRKIEAGESWFTPRELRGIRAELQRYLDGAAGSPTDRVPVERVMYRIGTTLSEPRTGAPAVSPDRRTRPR